MLNFNELNRRYENYVEDEHRQREDEEAWLAELDELGLLPIDLEKEDGGNYERARRM